MASSAVHRFLMADVPINLKMRICRCCDRRDVRRADGARGSILLGLCAARGGVNWQCHRRPALDLHRRERARACALLIFQNVKSLITASKKAEVAR